MPFLEQLEILKTLKFYSQVCISKHRLLKYSSGYNWNFSVRAVAISPMPSLFQVPSGAERWWNDGRRDAARKTQNRRTLRGSHQFKKKLRHLHQDENQNQTWIRLVLSETTHGTYILAP